MVQVTWEKAASNLGQLLEEVERGEEFVITRDDAPLARLSPLPAPRHPGSGVGIITYIAEDFDAPSENFQE